MLDAELFGKGPVGPHLTNLLLHAANVVLLFLLWLLRRLHGGDVAERAGGGLVRFASVARGIGGVGDGAQGRFERVFRAAVAVGVCALCAQRDK